MSATRFLGRLLYFLPLFAALFAFPSPPDRPLAPALFFIALAAYARLGALAGGRRGEEEALLFVEAGPFFAYAAAFLGRLSPGETLLSTAEATAVCGALLSAEALFVRGPGSFTTALFFIAFACAAGAAIASLPWVAVVGASALCIGLTRYGAARGGR